MIKTAFKYTPTDKIYS